MAAIPVQPTTANAIYAAIESRSSQNGRLHLGASQIGKPCRRSLWYSFRWSSRPQFDGRMLRLFRRGFLEEDQVVADLRAAGFEVHQQTEAGEQFAFSECGGHVGGSMDGAVKGIPEAPLTWHVLEVKTFSLKAFAHLLANGVEKSKPEHYAQVMLYMHWSGMTRALYIAVCKDNDEIYVERIRYDKRAAEALVARARAIVEAPGPLERISENPAWYQCKFCPFSGPCHEKAWSDVNCRTCAHSTPESDGAWTCAWHEKILTEDEQRAGCDDHVYIPDLVPADQVDASEQENWVEYTLQDGQTFRNGSGEGAHASKSLREIPESMLGDPNIQWLSSELGARVTEVSK